MTLTDEAFPRFAVVRAPRRDSAVGPFRSRADALEAAALMARFTGVRTCTNRLGRSAVHGPACPEREVSPCPATRGAGTGEYRAAAEDAFALIDGRSSQPLTAALTHIAELAERHRYETAARLRDHAAATIDVLWRGQRLRALTSVEEMVAAAPDGERGWRLAVIRHGQLAAAGVAPRGVPPMPVVDALCAGAQVVLPAAGPLGGRPGRGDGAHRAVARPARCADRAGRAGLLLSGQRGRALVTVVCLGTLGTPCRRTTLGDRPHRVRAAG